MEWLPFDRHPEHPPEGISRGDISGWDELDASTRRARRSGISAVPALVPDGRLLVRGSRPHAVFERALDAMRGEGPEAV